MSKKLLVNGVLAAFVLLVALAAVTLVPYSGAVMGNALNYSSVCPFAPWSTLMLLATAGILWVVRDYIIKRVN